MKKTILEVYALVVCLFAVIVITISSSTLIYNMVGVINPGLTMKSYTYEKYLNNDTFKTKRGVSKDEAKTLGEEEITARRETEFAQEIRVERRTKTQKLLNASTYLFASSIALLIHWKISKQSRETTA